MMAADGSSTPRTTRWQVVLVHVCLLVAVVAIYARTTSFDFVYYDDPDYVTRNAIVREGLTARGVAWALTSFDASNWHPVTWWSHMLDVELFGLDAGAHHRTSVILHLINAWLLFELLRRASGSLWPSAVVALLFAVHPAHVESVAWVAERKDVLSTLFFLAALLAYVGWVRRGGTARYLVVSGCFALALMAKPMVVTLPLVMLLFDAWPLARRAGLRVLLVEKLPWLAMAAASSAITVMAQRAGGSLDATDIVPLGHRVANAVVSYVRYLGLLVWPRGLCVLYPHPDLAGGTPWTAWQVGLAASLLVVLTVGALEVGRSRRYVTVGWLWYLVTLSPVIGVVQVGQQAMADRYTYIPYIGPFLIVAWTGAAIASSPSFRSRGARTVLGGLTLAVVVALSVAAWRQVGYWKSTTVLFERALAVTQPAPVVLTNLGAALAEEGRLDEAVAQYRRALEIAPRDPRAWNNLGLALQLQGHLGEAIRCYRRVLDQDPERLAPRHNLATALREAGRLDEAIAQYRQALLLHPDATSTREALEETLRRAGRGDAPDRGDE